MKNLKFLLSVIMLIILASFINANTELPFVPVAFTILLLGILMPKTRGLAFMAIYYDDTCEEEEVGHTSSDCEDVENARIRGVAFIRKGYTIANPALAADWITGITSGDIIIIPNTHGLMTPTPKEGPGFGDAPSRYIGTEYMVKFFDPAYAANRNFYNKMKKQQTKWVMAYKTETLVHIADKACMILPGSPIVDDVTGEVVWEVDVKWTSQDEPAMYTCPDGVFITFAIS